MSNVKNYRIFNGCHNCANLKDFSDYDTGNVFVCLLQYPEAKNLNRYNMKDNNIETVDEFGTCDEWKARDA